MGNLSITCWALVMFAVLLTSSTVRAARAAEWYVAPDGSDTNSGSIDSPWSVEHAFAAPAEVKPGDTIWLRGGTYTFRLSGEPYSEREPGSLFSRLTGTVAQPIKVRQYPGERATLDFGSARAGLAVQGGYTWYMGFEVMCSAPTRWLDVADYDKRGRPGVDLDPVPGIKLINLVVHDTVNCGIGGWHSGPDWEVNGCLVYHAGFDSQDRGHGHSFYMSSAMDDMTPKLLKDSIVFNNYCLGFQVYNYSGGRHLSNYELSGNVAFNSGIISRAHPGASLQILVGCHEVSAHDNIHDNYVYTSPGLDGDGMVLGDWSPLDSPIWRDNYVVAGTAYRYKFLGKPTVTGNTLCGGTGTIMSDYTRGPNPKISGEIESGDSGDATRYPDNTYLSNRPTSGLRIFVRSNDYEPGRANIIVYNWEGRKAVEVDVSPLLKAGDAYEVRDAQNFFGPPVVTGAYSGGSITIPLPDSTAPVAQVYGDPAHFTQPSHTSREFNVFILLRASGVAGPPSPLASP